MLRQPALGLAVLLALAACAGSPPQPALPLPGAVVASLARMPALQPNASRVTAAVNLVAPVARYELKGATTVHRWMPDDILRYKVVLAERTSTDVFDVANGVEALVPVKGTDPKTMAIFTDIPQGKYYRAFVTAEGNVAGVVADPFDASVFTTLNSTPGTADFDFTAANDVEANPPQKSVQVVFDDVPFNGTASVSFDPPAEGKFAQPSPAITGSAQ